MPSTTPSRRRRQRGFSLIVVFLLILIMVGIASAVMMSTQGDLQVAGHDREAATALYAAEAGITYAQWWLYRYPVPLVGQFTDVNPPLQWGAWQSFLNSAAPDVRSAFCTALRNVPGPPQALPPNPPV